jgi:Fe-S-cluster-containing dehydrogenase component
MTDRWHSLVALTRVTDPAPPPSGTPEFLPGVDEPPQLGRRDLAKLLGASLALASGVGCTRAPHGRILAYGQQPEDTPGVPQFYATTMTLGGYGTGLLVETHEGRPTKIEGNPEHPASLGAAGVFEQAHLLSLYDPNRLPGIRENGLARGYESIERLLQRPDDGLHDGLGGGAEAGASLGGVHIVLPPTTSPVLDALLLRVEARGGTVHVHDPLPRTAIWEGVRGAFGFAGEPIYELGEADVVVSLDCDVLGAGPFHLRDARAWATRRAVPGSAGEMQRMYVVEPAVTVTGSVADHRFPMRRSDVGRMATALLQSVLDLPQGPASPAPAWRAAMRASLAGVAIPTDVAAWARTVAHDLVAHRGRVALLAGEGQPAEVHAMTHLLNLALGAVGKTVRYVTPPARRSDGVDLARLLAKADEGAVHTLVILGGNPSYTAPADLEFGRRIRRVERRVYLTLYENETARDVQWVVPEAHGLESWGDARALDGTVSFSQPVIEPLYDGKTASELLSVILGESMGARQLLEAHWRGVPESSKERWPEALQRGVLGAAGYETLAVDETKVAARLELPASQAAGLEIAFQADPRVYDGAFTNNGWLLELPHPVTKLTWSNVACMASKTAARLGVKSDDIVILRVDGRSVRAPVWVAPGHAEDCVSVSLGFGRTGKEELADGVGFDAYALRTAASMWVARGVEIVPTGDRTSLAFSQDHTSMENRPIARSATLAELRADPAKFRGANAATPTLYHLETDAPQQWAMAIDLNICTGCSSCVVACQAENNVPIVGEAGVRKGRAMHWLRIDLYVDEGPKAVFHHEPMACQHCEKAPCEYVCPVGATVHSTDGLNEMVYNRCVGTRFCSNNCPYKVRRFNWFDYNRDKPETIRMAMNPDVTVRARGVMEKCTYCVQRVREAEIRRHETGAAYKDGDVRTACEQACPTRAITFGSLTDPRSRVSILRRDPRSYAVLHEVGTEPRTRYLARVTNPNPELRV